MSESIGQPAAAQVEPRTADSADSADSEVRPRPGTGPPGRPSLGWTEFVVAIVTFVVLNVAGTVALYLTGQMENTPLVLGSTASEFLVAVVVALSLRVRSLSAIGLRSTTWRWLLAGVGIGVVARIAAFGLVLGYQSLTGDQSNPQDALVGMAAAGGLSLVVLLVLGAGLTPFAEELMFRGVLYGAMRRYRVWIALVVSALVFGIAHGPNVVLPVAVALGAMNALLYERSRSIWPAVVAHAVHNGLGFGLAALFL